MEATDENELRVQYFVDVADSIYQDLSAVRQTSKEHPDRPALAQSMVSHLLHKIEKAVKLSNHYLP